MVFNKKKGAMAKRASFEMSVKNAKKETEEMEYDDFEDIEDSTGEMSENEGDGDAKNKSIGNLKNAKGKLTPVGRKDVHVSFQLPNKGSSPTKTPKSLQNTPFSGKKDLNTSLKKNAPVPIKKELHGTPNKASPMTFKKKAFASQNQSLVSSDKKNQVSPKQSNLKQFSGIQATQKAKGKHSNMVEAADLSDDDKDDDDDDDDNEDDDDDDNEDDDDDNEDDDDDDNDDDDDDDNEEDGDDVNKGIPAINKEVQLKNVPTTKPTVANSKQEQKQMTKYQQNNVALKKNQTVLGEQNSSALQGKKAANKKIMSTIPQREVDDEDDDDDDDDDDERDLENDDDDDSDDDDDNEDDDDDDDDDDAANEEDKVAVMKKLASLKKDIQLKSPESGKKKNPNNFQPKEGIKPKLPQTISEEIVRKEMERRDKQDACSLFVKGFPSDVTVEELKALSSDILHAFIPPRARKGKTAYGFLRFENEQKANENYQHLQGKKINGQNILVDFSGSKSNNKRITALDTRKVMKDRLHIEGLPVDTTIIDVAAMVPNAISIFMKSSSDQRTASVLFHNDEDAANAFKANENATVKGKSVVVMFAMQRENNKQNKRKVFHNDQHTGPASKKFRR